MKTNMGNADRLIRLIVAAIVIGLYAANLIGGWMTVIGLIIAVVFILTSVISFCPLYSFLGVSTCPKK